jgi:subfamily B ATP-binding cassette protein HlyB/CyaB
VVASLVLQLLALLVPLLTQTVIDKVITHRTMNTLAVVAAALTFCAAFTAALAWIRQSLVLNAGTRIDALLASAVFGHLVRLPARYFEHRSTGVLVARMHGVETIREFLTGAALTLVLDLPFMLLFLGIMLYYSVALTAVVLGGLAALMLLSLLATPLLRARIDRQFLAGARQQAFVTERLAAIETVKSLQLEPVLTRRFDTLFARYLEAGFHARRLSNTLGVSVQFVEQSMTVAVLCGGAWAIVQGATLTVGALIAFQMFASRLTAPALRIAALWQEFQQVHIAVRRLADIMDAPREPWRALPVRAARREGRLACKALGFRYPDQFWLFRGLTLELQPGQCLALIGPSGCGKSTLARLLQGFHLPSEGGIFMDGLDITRMAANELRGYFGVVPQEARLFSGTLLDNLLEAAPWASFEDAVRACRQAELHAAIEAMPDGYMSRIGENGAGLSGGQKQRLAIARALLKRPCILIFDEATAHLDPALAEALIATINALHGSISVLFIAHELPAGLRCDRVVRLGAEARERLACAQA